MSWFSILPPELSVFEVWAVRFFLFLGFVSIGPWLIVVVYDFFYYIYRVATYEIPVIGGRARGRQRPRAPSLVERPDGSHRRLPSLGGSPEPVVEEKEEEADEGEGEGGGGGKSEGIDDGRRPEGVGLLRRRMETPDGMIHS